MSKTELDQLKAVTRELIDLRSIADQLSWDQEVLMPSKGGGQRARQMSTLASLRHRRLTDPTVGELVKRLSDQSLNEWDRASVMELGRAYDKAVLLPEPLVRELAETTSLAYEAWVEARRRADFPSFAPLLGRMFELQRQKARCLTPEGGDLYETLLDDYEPGMTVERLEALFGHVRPRLAVLLKRIQELPNPPAPPEGRFPVDRQKDFGRRVLSSMGFDWDRGRLDVSPHPFCVSLSPSDVRMTTRYSEDDFAKSFFGMVHECGHGLYEQGLPEDRWGEFSCDVPSLGMHESQSLMWENMVARSRAFWVHWYPHLRGAFGDAFENRPLDDFLKSINRVEASLIRVEADEVTYGLHVVLRFELERDLIAGRLSVDDLEELWNKRMEDDLGIRPGDSSQGVLQDTHWSQGLIGYFPTYLLGYIYGAQIHAQARRELPDLDQRIEAGDLLTLRNWLLENVHRQGRTATADERVKRITGREPDASDFLAYIEEKYARLYGLSDSALEA